MAYNFIFEFRHQEVLAVCVVRSLSAEKEAEPV